MGGADEGARLMAYQCDECKKRGKTWLGGDPVCAFDADGKWKTDNWTCATMNQLRELCVARWHMDQACATLPFSDEEDCPYWLVLGWYKNRGRVEIATVIDGSESAPLTETFATQALKFWHQVAV